MKKFVGIDLVQMDVNFGITKQQSPPNTSTTAIINYPQYITQKQPPTTTQHINNINNINNINQQFVQLQPSINNNNHPQCHMYMEL